MMYTSCIEVPFASRSRQSTEGIGVLVGSCLLEVLGSGARSSAIVALVGPLGAGKTVLTGGIAMSLGISRSAVASPTFVLERNYRGRQPMRHLDLYRIDSPVQLTELGFEEELERPGLTVIEWAERAGDLLELYERIEVGFEVLGDDTRRITVRDFYQPSVIAGCFGVGTAVSAY
ncbi:MAG TPA: tRNA (adenosine(37)-N6)-threonylcarbamoyltransferase complex ATPase subunit type 1 TsaE [Candidatus Cryosericum sp.]|nr:tRNA (adenosine(37)-N6)-threonylcarbamoyltransferase complex ATPase subunit type 1 TsaE [Candidatus Cryosericum sp.]HPS70075.1 tRNA (adenosine(37)-N6)-threonylcarbamoyltransferase complex ATPase subunit type 1 TsaE [Candidatus Cryosericum sp.]